MDSQDRAIENGLDYPPFFQNSTMKRAILVIVIMMINNSIYSQNFIKLELLRVQNKLILPENYATVKLPNEVAKDNGWNLYDRNDDDTYLEILQDSHHNRSHILIQTDFFGNVKYAAVSNNLNSLITKKEIPTFILESCLKSLNNGFSKEQENIEILVNCVISRLEVCITK